MSPDRADAWHTLTYNAAPGNAYESGNWYLGHAATCKVVQNGHYPEYVCPTSGFWEDFGERALAELDVSSHYRVRWVEEHPPALADMAGAYYYDYDLEPQPSVNGEGGMA